MRPRIAALVVLAALAGACGIENDTTPRNINQSDGLQEQAAEVSTTLPSTASTSRLYLLTPPVGGESERLTPVPRRVDASPAALFEALVVGPLPDDPDDLHTALPAEVTLLQPPVITAGVLTLDLSEAVFQVSGATLIEALAQVVFTMSELASVDAIELTVDGERREWPTGDGSLTPAPLTTFDYPELNPTTQPDYPAPPAPAPATT